MSQSGVIIVGAGPTGLALALALARHSVPSIVLDSSDGNVVRRAARSCLLRPDTAALLPPLHGTRWRGWRVQRRRQLLEHIELDEDSAPLHLEQHTLETALRAALEGEKLTRIVTDSHLTELEQDSDGVTAHTRGPAGTWWRGSHLVGCDGARSTVRKLLQVRFAGRTAVERHAVAAVRTRLPWPEEALLHRDPGGVPGEVTARPLPRGTWRLDWLLPPRGELVTPEQLLERVHGTLSEWHGASGGKDTGNALPRYELLDTGVYTTHQRLARRWRAGRCFLAGDAAHLMGALGLQSVDEGLRDAANLAWKLSLAWHHSEHTGNGRLLDSYEAERRSAVAQRLRAVDQALPLVRRGGGLRTVLPSGSARAQLALLTDGHLGRGLLGAPPAYTRMPLGPPRSAHRPVPVGTAPGAPIRDVPVTGLDGTHGWLRERLGGLGSELLVLLVAPGTGVWDSRHWLSAGLMPQLAAAVESLPLRAELLVTESYPGAAAHTVLVVRPDGHLVAALAGVRTAELHACAEAVRGEFTTGEVSTRERRPPGTE